ncbi:MAG: MlaD family protein [Planctomycetota bacterium]
MTQKSNPVKLGLFVVLGVLLGVATAFWLGAQRLNEPFVRRVTYFDESVQGLELGAPLKLRGVVIGRVCGIGFGPEHRLVEVSMEVFVDKLVALRIVPDASAITDSVADSNLPEDLRIELASSGITGVKFLQVDFFPDVGPPMELPFEPPSSYIPSVRSTLKGVEDTFDELALRMPRILEEGEALLVRVRTDLEAADLGALVGDVRRLVDTVDGRLAAFDVAAVNGLVGRVANDADELSNTVRGLGDDARATLEELRLALAEARVALNRVTADAGPIDRVVASVEDAAQRAGSLAGTAEAVLREGRLGETTASLRGAAGAAEGLSGELGAVTVELERTLVTLQSALRAAGRLADHLERQPSSILRGRPAVAGPPPLASDR